MMSGDTSPRLPLEDMEAAFGDDLQFLGRGTYGDTWRRGSGALKVLCGAPTEPARVQREIDGLSSVKHPNVVALHRTAEVQIGSARYMVLEFEYVAGGDVLQRVERKEWPTEDEASAFLRGLLEGVEALHDAGSLHRDIKPANVALRDGDWASPVILDLGLSKQIDASSLTNYPALVGSVRYASPEQLRGERARRAADLWSVGVTVRHVLDGRHPFYPEEGLVWEDIPGHLQSGPHPIRCSEEGLQEVLDRLVQVAEYKRGSATSNLRRLRRRMGELSE